MNKEKKIIIIVGVCCCIACVVINQPAVYVAFAIVVLFSLLNLYVFNKKRFRASNINNLNVTGRNYDTLIIGEPVDNASLGLIDNKCISVTCHGRSLGASKILAYRLFSLLHPNGTLIITCHNRGNKILSLDIPYIHDVTLLELGINKWKKYLPLLFNPIISLQVAVGTGHHHAKRTDNDKELEKFCSDRQIKLLTYQV